MHQTKCLTLRLSVVLIARDQYQSKRCNLYFKLTIMNFLTLHNASCLSNHLSAIISAIFYHSKYSLSQYSNRAQANTAPITAMQDPVTSAKQTSWQTLTRSGNVGLWPVSHALDASHTGQLFVGKYLTLQEEAIFQ